MNGPFNPALGGLLLLGLGVASGICGVFMIWYSARITRMAVAHRVDLVRGKNPVPLVPANMLGTIYLRTSQDGGAGAELQTAARLFARIGIPAAHARKALLAARFIAIAGLGLAVYFVAGSIAVLSSSPPLHLLASAGVGLAGWFLPGVLIGRAIGSRADAIVAGLPDALELLVICVEAGLSLEDGIDRIVGELRSSQPALAEELALTSADLHILPSRDVALDNLAARIDRPSVHTVVTTLSQTLRYGTPLAQALRNVAAELRNDALMRLEERANQLPTLMTIPMMIFIMPTIFLIVGGPAALRLLDALHR
jgi:tight adherence protein C